MNQELFRTNYEKYNLDEDSYNKYVNTIVNFENYINSPIEKTTIGDIKNFVQYLINTGDNNYNNLIHIARYYYYIGKSEHYIHMTKYFNSIGVLENIIDRINLFSNDINDDLIASITLPEFGTESFDLPKYTKDFMDKINKYLPRNTCNKILAGNNHKIPKSSFLSEKDFYEKSRTLKSYLKERHSRKVAELKYHYTNNLVWFEQIISKQAIEYVSNNQEILSGVLKNNKLYITKIPYQIDKYLAEKDSKLKRYYACHCSFVRENILSEKVDIPKEWCYCSGGFAKAPFEVILDQELEVRLLKTPLDGDYVCRFEIDLSDVPYKK